MLARSKINLTPGPGFKPSNYIRQLRADNSLYDEKGITKKDITFKSLSTVATFVTGRTTNGLICWKTEDGNYVRNRLKKYEKRND